MSRTDDSDPDLEAEGTAAIEDQPAGVDDVLDGVLPPLDHPPPVADEVTAAEQRVPEPVRQRLWREEPDRLHADREDVGRLVQPDQGVVDVDVEPEEIADEVADDHDALTAEEQAMHITDNP